MPVKVTRRKFSLAMGSIFSALGITAGLGLAQSAEAQVATGVQKLDYDGKPASGKQMITSLIVHNGLIYISGQGANDAGSVQHNDIETHTTKVMDNVKKLVEAGGGTMDSILQLTVYLGKLDDYDGMNKVFKTYFPHGGPARTTVAVAGVPGHSLLEINCIAAVTRK
ncbi:MAG TPA: RidA family protein [Terriglobales bacterium]|nr:RidA family protein [Terriglobales bacterium]